MVFTGAENIILFESNDQIYTPNTTAVQLVKEGISEATELIDFNKDTLQNIADNIFCPGGNFPDPNHIAPAPFTVSPHPVTTITTPPFVFGTKYQKTLLLACDLIWLYETIGSNVTEDNIQWVPITSNFGEQ